MMVDGIKATAGWAAAGLGGGRCRGTVNCRPRELAGPVNG